jgi:hypothetical protein
MSQRRRKLQLIIISSLIGAIRQAIFELGGGLLAPIKYQFILGILVMTIKQAWSFI